MNKLILYDDKCNFCVRIANWCLKKNPDFKIMSVRDSESKDLLRSSGVQFIDLQTIYFVYGEHVYVRSLAVFKIFGFFNHPWKLISLFQYLPLGFTDYCYKIFAKYRYYF